MGFITSEPIPLSQRIGIKLASTLVTVINLGQIGINLGADRLHDIAGQAVAGRSINVKNGKAAIETEGANRKDGFRVESSV